MGQNIAIPPPMEALIMSEPQHYDVCIGGHGFIMVQLCVFQLSSVGFRIFSPGSPIYVRPSSYPFKKRSLWGKVRSHMKCCDGRACLFSENFRVAAYVRALSPQINVKKFDFWLLLLKFSSHDFFFGESVPPGLTCPSPAPEGEVPLASPHISRPRPGNKLPHEALNFFLKGSEKSLLKYF